MTWKTCSALRVAYYYFVQLYHSMVRTSRPAARSLYYTHLHFFNHVCVFVVQCVCKLCMLFFLHLSVFLHHTRYIKIADLQEIALMH